MSDSAIIHPDYIRIVERKPNGWLIKTGTLFYKRLAVNFQDLELLYGVSKEEMLAQLSRLNQGKQGFYLADLRHRQYRYCGVSSDSIKPVLRELGIGRIDPREN
ncbi:hypothetical protein [Thermoleptolyngbya sp. C42_A2020_037]|uniref:hypothetical protein n=1 Tax=Thermoleptolyngbya sp. C42_A2020_037 TaxID=2747799 RepID=UPI0019F5855E|nr:hypothetical protein [Thermoleptolyngbya sp. C42_A2020_037]MBF2085406.1 hypothetical protein [Thermoleptolyngbya sp. C42_A2020_037]